jgi:alpha,alpha-trehalase
LSGRSQCPDVPSGENPRPRQQGIGDSAGATQYDALANARQQAIEKYLWNDKEGWYADYDLKTHKVRNQLTAAALFRCTSMPRHASERRKWRRRRVAAAQTRRADHHHRQQRPAVGRPQRLGAAAVGGGRGPAKLWPAKIAMEVTWRFLTNVQHTYDSKQKLVEKYDVSSTGTGGGGEYPLQDGFGWTNGVTLKMLDLICPQKPTLRCLPATRPATAPSAQSLPAANDPAPADAKDRLLTLFAPSLPKS